MATTSDITLGLTEYEATIVLEALKLLKDAQPAPSASDSDFVRKQRRVTRTVCERVSGRIFAAQEALAEEGPELTGRSSFDL